MSCSDSFFPGNAKTKLMLTKCSPFKTLLQDCFTALNDLIDGIMECYPPQQFEKIQVQKIESLGDNCSIIIHRAHQVERFLRWKGFDVEVPMDTVMYTKLNELNKNFEEQLQVCKHTQYSLAGIALSLSFFLTLALVKNGYIATDYDISTVGILKALFCVLAIFVMIATAIDMAFSVIYGAFERKELEQFLQEYTTALEEFKPAAHKWCIDMLSILDAMKDGRKKTSSTPNCSPTKLIAHNKR
ncbi:hypothetical protein ACJMK2_001701 [Sinanodonta woodiana]|uniref:Uncharacterized protein n=1 Tax=Sinanodonta woodiana TaxID=1069815 RepID=A0ABD3XW77_SINWO